MPNWFPPQYLSVALNELHDKPDKRKEYAEKMALFDRTVSKCIECESEVLIFTPNGVEHHPLYLCPTCREVETVTLVSFPAAGGKFAASKTDAGRCEHES